MIFIMPFFILHWSSGEGFPQLLSGIIYKITEEGKMEKTIQTSLLLVFMIVVSGCENKPVLDKGKETAEVTQAIHNSIGWAKNKNLETLYSIIADDPNYIEVQPNGRVVHGIDNFKKAEAFWMDPRFKAVRYEIRDLKINFSKSRDVVWFFCMLDDINEWDGQPANWENTRWTGVLEKRDGKWRTVQQHFSFASE